MCASCNDAGNARASAGDEPLTRMLAVADTMSTDTGLASPLLSVYDHGCCGGTVVVVGREVEDWKVRNRQLGRSGSVGGFLAFSNTRRSRVPVPQMDGGDERWYLTANGGSLAGLRVTLARAENKKGRTRRQGLQQGSDKGDGKRQGGVTETWPR